MSSLILSWFCTFLSEFDICDDLQAGLIQSEAKMPEQGESEELEKLRLEHFYLAFAILGGGLALSLVILMGEMCSSRLCSKNETS